MQNQQLTFKQRSIGREAAIAMGKLEWWKHCTPVQIVQWQANTKELCLPFSEFQKACEEVMGREVFTHEFASETFFHELSNRTSN